MHVDYATRDLSSALFFLTICFCSNGWINYVSWTMSLFTWLSEERLSTKRSENPSRLKTKLKSGIQEWNEQSNRFRITKNRLDSGTKFTSEVQAFLREMRTSILMVHLRHDPTSWDVDTSFFFFFPIQLYWTYTRTVNIHKRQSTTKWKLQLEADKKERNLFCNQSYKKYIFLD